MINSIAKPTFALFIITIVAAVIMGLAYVVTEEPILRARHQSEMNAIASLLPENYSMNFIYLDDHDSNLTRLAISYNEAGERIGYVFSAAPTGYSGPVFMMIALNTNGVISGVRVISHTETPGLGSQITAGWFLEMFEGRSGYLTASRNPASLQEIDLIASATISVNAVLRGINDAVSYFDEELRN